RNDNATLGQGAGTSLVIVNPGAILRIRTAANLSGASSLNLQGNPTGVGSLALDLDFDPSSVISSAFVSPYGGVLQINISTFTTGINQASFPSGPGNGPVFVGALQNANATG